MAHEDPNRPRARQILEAHKGHKGALLVALLDIQYELGYLPEAAILDAADVLGHSEPEVWGVITFYADFKVGRDSSHFLDVCVDGPCHVAGADRIRAALEQWRESHQGDRPIQVRAISCPGMCSTAPIVAVDMKYFANMTPEKALARASALKDTPVQPGLAPAHEDQGSLREGGGRTA
jgi:NADH:ubiquinone oxidoreductase subunit E